MKPTENLIELHDQYGAHIYEPLPVVIASARGVWVEDVEGQRYLDMLSAYSALNQGHRHPHIIQALKKQADKVTLTSRAFHSELLSEWLRAAAALTGKERVLPMNTGAEAVETAVKLVRRWACDVKGVPEGQAEIIVCEGNFHGRTLAAASMSANPRYQRGFGPLTPGFRVVPYGSLQALEQALTPHTAALLIEPIQGEAGIRIPPAQYLKRAAELCKSHQVLLAADEIQTGLGRTGKMFACEWEGVVPDLYILGKALGGGVMPISAVCADSPIMNVLDPGSHGSTFGGNPLACAVSLAALEVIRDEKLAEQAEAKGYYMLNRLRHMLTHPRIREIRGRGLLIGIELTEPARPYCEQLMSRGVLTKETHVHTVRLAPPLVISYAEMDWALEQIAAVLQQH